MSKALLLEMIRGGLEGPGALLQCPCGLRPGLRLRPMTVFNRRIEYLRFECRCGRHGGMAFTEEDCAFTFTQNYVRQEETHARGDPGAT